MTMQGMRRVFCLLILPVTVPFAAAALGAEAPSAGSAGSPRRFGLVMHGGAGDIRKGMIGGTEAQHRAKMKEALDAGYAVLDRGGSALDAVQASIRILEDSGMFNAGRGAYLDSEGVCELDAAIMDGRTLGAGGVAGLRHIRSPISLARDVMERSPNVLLMGSGAEAFAQAIGYPLVPNESLQSEERRQQWERAKAQGTPVPADKAHGTVGCAALDRNGNLAAGTSTGGTPNKKYGRVGDSPIIGAGTYANNATCAVSATGIGEFFIRGVVSYDVSAQMEYKGLPLEKAASNSLAKVGKLGGSGGLIAIDREGHVTAVSNTPGMYRAFRLSDGSSAVKVFPNED